MITRIYIDNYKSLVNFEYRPQRVNLLVGRNGSGKSSIFEALRKIKAIVSSGHRADKTFDELDLTRWSDRDSQKLEIDVRIENGSFNYGITIKRHPFTSQCFIENEKLSLDGIILYDFSDKELSLYDTSGTRRISLPFGDSRSFLPELEQLPWSQPHLQFRRFVEQTGVFKPDPRNPEVFSQKEDPELANDCSNFTDWYRSWIGQYPERAADIGDILRPTIQGLKSLRLLTAGGARYLVFESTQAGKKYNLSINQLSDGQRMLLLLAGIACAPAYPTLVLDEPDNYLSPDEVQPIINTLEQDTADSRQLFVISHNPNAIDYLASRSAVILKLEDGVTRLQPLSDIDLDGERLSELIADGTLA